MRRVGQQPTLGVMCRSGSLRARPGRRGPHAAGSIPPLVAGGGGGRAVMAARMDLDPVSQTPGPWPGPVIASSAPARPAERRSYCERRAGHPVTPKRRPCSPRPGTRGQGPDQRPAPRPSARRTGGRRSSRPARVTGYARWPGTAASAGRAGAGPGLLSRSASACRCAGVSGGAASASSLIQASRPLLPEWRAGCPLWS